MDKLEKLLKFSTEAQLNVFAEEKLYFTLEGLNILKDESYLDNFHIYAILARPRYSFEKSALKATKSGISINILDANRNGFCRIPDYKFKMVFKGTELDDFDYRFIHLNCESPFNRIDFSMFPNEGLIKYLMKKVNLFESEEIIKKDIIDFKFSCDIEDLVTQVCKRTRNNYEMEVLYIGQAQGREANRGAIERLQSHETLQKILIDCHEKYVDKRIFIMLFKFAEQQIMFMNGANPFLATKEDDDHHHNLLVDDAIDIATNTTGDRMRQVINITEAAMINYFKPHYNDKFVENFPSQKHQSYSHYYNLEYNQISVELGLDSSPQIALFTNQNRIQSVWDFIEYEMFPRDRASIYDIFRNLPR